MNGETTLKQPLDLADLNQLSAEVGNTINLVQGAGGNTSLKADGVLWIKASGTWLANATRRNIMVPVRLDALRQVIDANDPRADQASEFVVHDQNPEGLRPSIETTVHAVLPQRVVLHVHCVDTIAVAVRADAEQRLAALLADEDYAFVPYIRPGLPLARAIRSRIDANTDVLVLANHGLVVAGDSIASAKALLDRVSTRLRQPPRHAETVDLAALEGLAVDSEYRLPTDAAAHGVGVDAISRAVAVGGSLYPDHVIFLGVGSVIAEPGETAAMVAARFDRAGLPAPVEILMPDRGVLVRDDATAGAEAMARCLADVTARLDDTAEVSYLSAQDNQDLLGWDQEKYRQSLNAQQGIDGGLPA